MYVLDLFVFSQNTPHSAAVTVRCVHLGLRVCVHVSLSISSGGSMQNCLKVLHRFGSFRDTSLSYETLKALWFDGMFSLQRDSSAAHSWISVWPCVNAVEASCRCCDQQCSSNKIKHARKPLVDHTTQWHNHFGIHKPFSCFFFCKLKVFVLIS